MSTQVPREKAVFCEALEIADPAERRQFLDQACGADPALREQVEKLLALSQVAGGFFKDCAPALEPDAADAAQVLAAAESALEPEIPETKCIGPYKLLEKVGEGGYGVVYMAEQERPIRRRVALKIIKLGMDTKNVIARFEAERQALALMDHPNIARVLDAGATESGRPYFVMELVYGVKVTEYCDQNRVGMRERLELFIQVCNAVQHAHQKGIIHRDLKPSNIMVTMHDGVPVPKVIDFGIAKATGQRLTDKTLYTSYAQLMGTPAYMSPEQMELSGLNLDTRSDIYSLGVLLYELLTGRTPFDTTDLLKLGVDELRRTVREQEPLSPSAKLRTLNNEELTKTARRRHLEPLRLLTQVRGDLDWIVLKCLEKDRTRRYATATGLAEDIERYLHEEAVEARPPSRLYRLQKLVRRNRMVFLFGAAAVAALLIGLGASIWLYFKERTAARQEAFLRHEAEVARGKEAELRHAAELHSRIADATLLAKRWKLEEAEKLLSGIPLEQPSSAAAEAVRAVGDWYAAHGRWSEAVERFTALVKLDELDDVDGVSLDYWALSIALVEAQDLRNYEHLRRTTFARLPEATEIIADRIIKMHLLAPANPQLMADLSPYVAAAEKAFAGAEGDTAPNSFRAAWNALALGLLEYRKGNSARAAEWCRRSIVYSRIEEPRDSTAHILLGMSLWRMNEQPGALDELRKGRTAIETKFRLGLGPRHGPEGNWFDWVFARRLLREADDLMQLTEPKP